MKRYPEDVSTDPVGDIESLATLLSGALSTIPGGIAGIFSLLKSGGDINQAADSVRNTQEALTYQPRTEGGRENLQAIANHPIMQGLGYAQQKMGDAGFALGGPVGGVIGEMAPDILDLVFGSHGAGMADNAIIAGLKAKNAPIDTFADFLELERDIGSLQHRHNFEQTGWYRHEGDLKPRWEIKDHGLELDADALYDLWQYNKSSAPHASQSLEDIIAHDALSENYPDLLENTRLNFDTTGSVGMGGSYSANPNRQGAGLIQLGGDLAAKPASAKSVILHELQHAVQDIENHARGANSGFMSLRYNDILDEIEGKYDEPPPLSMYSRVKDWSYKDYLNVAGEVEARMVQDRWALPMVAESIAPPMWMEQMGYPMDQQILLVTPGEVQFPTFVEKLIQRRRAELERMREEYEFQQDPNRFRR